MSMSSFIIFFFFFNDTATTEIYTLSLHDALPISSWAGHRLPETTDDRGAAGADDRHHGRHGVPRVRPQDQQRDRADPRRQDRGGRHRRGRPVGRHAPRRGGAGGGGGGGRRGRAAGGGGGRRRRGGAR